MTGIDLSVWTISPVVIGSEISKGLGRKFNVKHRNLGRAGCLRQRKWRSICNGNCGIFKSSHWGIRTPKTSKIEPSRTDVISECKEDPDVLEQASSECLCLLGWINRLIHLSCHHSIPASLLVWSVVSLAPSPGFWDPWSYYVLLARHLIIVLQSLNWNLFCHTDSIWLHRTWISL